MIFIQYNDDTRKITKINEQQLLDYFEGLGAQEEELLNANIWKHALEYLTGWFGDWHEFTVVESTNWYWSFEKQSNAIYVQRSKKLADVKYKIDGSDRKNTVKTEGRSTRDVGHNENIYNIMEWIINRRELHKTYHLTNSNCHFFASLLYEAVCRDCGRRLDNTK